MTAKLIETKWFSIKSCETNCNSQKTKKTKISETIRQILPDSFWNFGFFGFLGISIGFATFDSELLVFLAVYNDFRKNNRKQLVL